MWQRKRALSAREEDLGKPERSGDKSASRIALAYGDGSQLNRRVGIAGPFFGHHPKVSRLRVQLRRFEMNRYPAHDAQRWRPQVRNPCRAAAALGCVSVWAERLNGGREALTVQPPQLVAALRRN